MHPLAGVKDPESGNYSNLSITSKILSITFNAVFCLFVPLKNCQNRKYGQISQKWDLLYLTLYFNYSDFPNSSPTFPLAEAGISLSVFEFLHAVPLLSAGIIYTLKQTTAHCIDCVICSLL